jgi:hypothetical protein
MPGICPGTAKKLLKLPVIGGAVKKPIVSGIYEIEARRGRRPRGRNMKSLSRLSAPLTKLRARISGLINRDPNLPPVKARVWCAITFAAISVIYLITLQHLGLAVALQACGIVVGIFGADVLYWETVADVQELRGIYNETARMGASMKLSLGAIVGVIVFALLGFWMAWLQGAVIVLSAKHNPNQVGLYTALRVLVVFIFYALPAVGAYGGEKWMHRFCNRWAERFRASPDMTAEIKRFLRLIGFRSLFFAGLAQLPATFVSPH